MGQSVEEFNAYRQRMNERLMQEDQKILKRVFNLDTNAYMEGHLPMKPKSSWALATPLCCAAMIVSSITCKPVLSLGSAKKRLWKP